MKALVLDASLALEWFLPGGDAAALAKRRLLDDRVAVVPHLWRFEVMNVIARRCRRQEFSQAEATAILNDIVRLPFGVVDQGNPDSIVMLAVQHEISAYDAAYVNAAMLTGEPLATLDKRLQACAQAIGVTVL